MRRGFHVLLLLPVVLWAACQNGRQTHSDKIPATDSAREEVRPFPDTIFASVAAVKFQVDILDSVALGLKYLEASYTCENGVRTFRGTPLRDASFGGRVQGTPSRVEVEWMFRTASDTQRTKWGTWYGGSGWTGQPLYLKKSNEIIVGSLCGKVYFIDFLTGKSTREPLPAGNPIKGTPSLDPEFDNLYVGQGIPGKQPFGCMAFDLQQHSRTFFFDRDSKALRGWNAFDSSPIVVGGYLFWPGENGSLYQFERKQGKLRLVCALRYTVNGMAPGIENSLCAYRNYAWFGDNRGNILCVNLHTMRPVWRYDNHDDIDGTLVCKVEDGVPYVYAATEVDHQGEKGMAYLVKLNGLDGSLVWEQQVPCNRFDMGSKSLDGGFYCTPLLGQGDADGLLFANVCRNGGDGRGRASGQFMAFSTKDGRVAYATQLRQFAWSSPVGFLNEKNEMFVLTGDSGGYVYLLRARTGEILYKAPVAANFESSPVVVGNAAVVGSRSNGIYKLVVK